MSDGDGFIRIDNLQRVANNFKRLSQDTQDNLQIALKIALRDVVETAKNEHRFISRSGNTERSIRSEEHFGYNFYGVVGSSSKISLMLHKGTKPHDIKPRRTLMGRIKGTNKSVLRWADGSNFHFARRVHHPGTKPDPFIYNALNTHRTEIIRRFQTAVDKAIAEMG